MPDACRPRCTLSAGILPSSQAESRMTKVWMTMATLVRSDPKELIRRDLAALREYAGRVVVQGERLTAAEEEDVAAREQEFFAVGSSFRLTRAEMVALLFRGLLTTKRGCACHSCRVRDGSLQFYQ